MPSGDSQRPRVHVTPRGVTSTDGDLAGTFSAAYGLTPDPWQRFVLDDWLGLSRGRWASLTCGLAVPRQNGKNALLEIRELYGAVGLGERILHTAHELKTAQKHFRRLRHFFGDRKDDPGARFPELNALVKTIRLVNGQEAVLLHTTDCKSLAGGLCRCDGGSIEVVARSKNSGRGFTVDVLVMDEAQELAEDDLEALMPTTSAAPLGNPQWIFTGTPPGPTAQGNVFTRVREEALGEKPGKVSWHEWSVDGRVDLDDRALWRMTNPALDAGRLQVDVIEGERARFTDDGFLRERLGQWPSFGSKPRAIPFSEWSVLKASKPTAGRVAFGVKFTPDGSTVALAGGIRPDDGPIHVEGFRQENLGEGFQWLVDFLAKRATSTSLIVVDGKSGAGALAAALRDEGLTRRGLVVIPTLEQVVSAHAMFLEAVKGGGLSHLGQAPLDEQVKDATRRLIGKAGAFGWDPDKGESVALLDAATYAFWGAKVARTDPTASRADASRRRAANTSRRGR